MNQTILKIETYACEMCGYYQDANPFIPGSMSRMFPEFSGIPDGACPACYSGRNDEQVKRICQLSRLEAADIRTTTTTASDSELEERQVEVRDESDNLVMEQTGERQKLGIVDGKPAVLTEPVFSPKMRSLTTQELTEMKLQRDQNLDALESVAVKEVAPD